MRRGCDGCGLDVFKSFNVSRTFQSEPRTLIAKRGRTVSVCGGFCWCGKNSARFVDFAENTPLFSPIERQNRTNAENVPHFQVPDFSPGAMTTSVGRKGALELPPWRLLLVVHRPELARLRCPE